MSGRRRALLVALLAAFAALALAISSLLGGGPGEPVSPKQAAVANGAPADADQLPAGALRDTRRERRPPPAHDGRHLAQGPREAPPPERMIERRDHEVLAEAAPVARRFLHAFAAYELGRLGEARADLRATATPGLFSELVGKPPRVPSGSEPERARLAGGLDLVPIAADRTDRELTELELVGALDRGGERTPIGVRMHRKDGGWRVAGLTE